VRRTAKHEKLLQYAERVWHITQGSEEQKIDQAIALTEDFFQKMAMPVRLSDIELGAADIDVLMTNLEAHGMVALGEKKEINLEISRQILEQAS
jgi:NADP-dependent alcohol dehydrogenase